MSCSMKTVVCIPPGFVLDPNLHKNKENSWAWDQADREYDEDSTELLNVFIDQLLKDNHIHVQSDASSDISMEYDCEHVNMIKWLCHIFANTKYLIWEYEDGSHSGGDEITNVFEEIRTISNALHKEARITGKFKWVK